MPKADVSMSEAEVLAFLAAPRQCVVACRTLSGGLVTALGDAVLQGEVLRVRIPSDDPAGDALREDGRVCCMVEESPSYYEVVSVGVRGYVQDLSVGGDRLGFDLPVSDLVGSSFAKLRQT
jgi:hypothetical protein